MIRLRYREFSPMVDHPNLQQKHRKNATSRISGRVRSKILTTLVGQHNCSRRERWLKLSFETYHSMDCLWVYTNNNTITV